MAPGSAGLSPSFHRRSIRRGTFRPVADKKDLSPLFSGGPHGQPLAREHRDRRADGRLPRRSRVFLRRHAGVFAEYVREIARILIAHAFADLIHAKVAVLEQLFRARHAHIRQVIDKIAAVFILQSYLDAHGNT